MNQLQSRKQLLIAESELNRAQFVQEWEGMAEGARSIAARARSLKMIVSSAAVVAAGMAAFRRGKRAQAGAKTSWLKSILRTARLLSGIWLAFRSAGRSRDET
ncbi:MAG TPA: hypothetical protein VGR14_00705 [Verrucomicrobiae bacterium]|nr:hypothetical protein [Verrucomicrobiae bacterium]